MQLPDQLTVKGLYEFLLMVISFSSMLPAVPSSRCLFIDCSHTVKPPCARRSIRYQRDRVAGDQVKPLEDLYYISTAPREHCV